MTADEIRDAAGIDNAMDWTELTDLGRLQVLAEIAAQLAEINERENRKESR